MIMMRMAVVFGFSVAMFSSAFANDVTKCDDAAIDQISDAIAMVVDSQDSEKVVNGNMELTAH